jgi:ferredoxin
MSLKKPIGLLLLFSSGRVPWGWCDVSVHGSTVTLMSRRYSNLRASAAVVLSIRIDASRCMGSGSCTFWAPGTFDVGDDNVVVVLDPSGDEDERIRKAVEACPTQALSLAEDQSD